jgi:hypothetical protein
MADGLGVDDPGSYRRFRAHHHTRAAPLTNGWFALFSGISACPVTAWFVKRNAGITLSGWTRFVIGFIIIMLGRLGIEDRRTGYIPDRPVTMLERRLLLISVEGED